MVTGYSGPVSRRVVQVSTVHRTRDNRIYNKECRALVEAGLDVTLLIRAEADEQSPVPVRALPTPASRLTRLTTMQFRAWRELGRLRPDLVHVHDPELIPMALLWARTHRAAVVYDAHEDLVKQVDTKPYLGSWRRGLARGYGRFLLWLANSFMDGIVAATPDIAAGFTGERVAVVHNYPWLSDFAAERDPVPGRLVYTGDLTEERRLSFMRDVVAVVRRSVPEAHLVLAGVVGPAVSEEARSFDGDLVRHLGLLPPSRIPEVLATAELGLIFLAPLPNYVNSLPTKLFEYQAAGLPAVASDFPHWRDIFGGDGATVFVDSGDVEATASRIVELLGDRAELERLSVAGRVAVRGRFNFESQAEALVGLVERAASTTDRSRVGR